jgi:hypothetical protein
LETDGTVYCDESVPATAIHTTSNLTVVAANALELQRGGLRVEGLTLLPPNPLFLVLSFLSFGLQLGTPLSWTTNPAEETVVDKKANKAYTWLMGRNKVCKTGSSGSNQIILSYELDEQYKQIPIIWEEAVVKDRLLRAVLFHESSLSMGEKLVCFPDKIHELCKLFDGVDGNNLFPWSSLGDEALTSINLTLWQKERKASGKEEQHIHVPTVTHSSTTEKVGNPSPAMPHTKGTNKTKRPESASSNKKRWELERHGIHAFDGNIKSLSNQWFSTTLNTGESFPEFPSTNILALLFLTMGQLVSMTYPTSHIDENNFFVSLSTENWDIACYKKKSYVSPPMYNAIFVNKSIPDLPITGRGKNKLPKWIKKSRGRPSTVAEAKECVPPNIKCPNMVENPSEGLLFESIHDALHMEAAFWLERQFCHAGKASMRHWFMHPIDQMVAILSKHHQVQGSIEADT